MFCALPPLKPAFLLWAGLLLALAGCFDMGQSRQPQTASEAAAAPAAFQSTPMPTATPALTPTAESIPTPLPQPTPFPTSSASPPVSPQICSPVEGFGRDQLQKSITNPFNPPRAGSDDPHQAIDIADMLPNSRIAVEGRAVRSMLAGKAALASRDRFPYGNLVIIETPLRDLPPAWLEQLQLSKPDFNFRSTSALTCPALTPAPAWNREESSLYLLYAHLKDAPSLKTGDSVGCGSPLGAIGKTGNALNPHLHLEARVGPAGARFAGMAHYDASASAQEMAAYCAWRISGVFALVNPMRLLGLLP